MYLGIKFFNDSNDTDRENSSSNYKSMNIISMLILIAPLRNVLLTIDYSLNV